MLGYTFGRIFQVTTCGGFLGDMSTGEDLVMRMGVKATPTISKD